MNPLKIIGAILLIVGTSIGGGMLALPVATANLGFFLSALYLFFTWLLMTLAALLILEVNAWLPMGSNLISMAGKTVGKLGQVLAWIAYLLLLYSLLSAYVAGGQDVVSSVFASVGIEFGRQWAAAIFTVVFALVVFCGIRQVDWLNRIIMLIKLFAYFAMVMVAVPFVNTTHLMGAYGIDIGLSSLMIMVTSFGFAIIVPSLRAYFHNDIVTLRRAVIIGSFVPLFFYLAWEAIIFSVLPETGPYSLHTLAASSQPVSTLMEVLSHISQHTSMVLIAKLFTSVCVLTAFMGVSLCLVDFLADGLKLRKTGLSGLMILFMTFLPPLCIALFAQKLFVYGLSFAGVFCVFLLIFLPAWMAWAGRYQQKLSGSYQVLGGKTLLLALMGVSVVLLGIAILGV